MRVSAASSTSSGRARRGRKEQDSSLMLPAAEQSRTSSTEEQSGMVKYVLEYGALRHNQTNHREGNGQSVTNVPSRFSLLITSFHEVGDHFEHYQLQEYVFKDSAVVGHKQS
ncbi:hypothetical protein TNIN_460101 [Trichonephila inaurata madagascariensis]|uniref:Uncharacterized protein n=1 Tax=Trichonephila inaurata madagascariensis TaxID=2747483 RepID=A0A8X6XRR8_9ARAC|nr:hypothetical protein TNIN_460101 [Trichonephila inaurata madagascariensis]